MKINLYTNVKSKAHIYAAEQYGSEHQVEPSKNTLDSIFSAVIITEQLDFNPTSVDQVVEAIEMNVGIDVDENCEVHYPCDIGTLTEVCSSAGIDITMVDNTLLDEVREAKVQLLVVLTGEGKIVIASIPVTSDFTELSERLESSRTSTIFLMFVKHNHATDSLIPNAELDLDRHLQRLVGGDGVFRTLSDREECIKNKVFYEVQFADETDVIDHDIVSISCYAGSTMRHACAGVPILRLQGHDRD